MPWTAFPCTTGIPSIGFLTVQAYHEGIDSSVSRSKVITLLRIFALVAELDGDA